METLLKIVGWLIGVYAIGDVLVLAFCGAAMLTDWGFHHPHESWIEIDVGFWNHCKEIWKKYW